GAGVRGGPARSSACAPPSRPAASSAPWSFVSPRKRSPKSTSSAPKLSRERNRIRVRSRRRRTFVKAVALILFGVCALSAQTPAPSGGNPMLAEIKQAYTGIKNNLTRMAEKMPAESYDFKPVTEIPSFGPLMGHVAESQMPSCSTVNGATKGADVAPKTAKDDIVAPLKASFVECDKAFDDTTDANAIQMVGMGGRGQASRLGILTRFVVTHGNEEYGYGAIYLRLKNIVPPSSDNPGRGGR